MAAFAAFAISVLNANYRDWAVINSKLQPHPAHSVTSTVPICCYFYEGFCFVGVCWADATDREAHPFASLTLRLCYGLCAYACFDRKMVWAIDLLNTASFLVRELCSAAHFREVTLSFNCHKSHP